MTTDEKQDDFLEQFFQSDTVAFEFDKIFDLDIDSSATVSTPFNLSLVWEIALEQKNPSEHYDLNETIDIVKQMYKEQVAKTEELQYELDTYRIKTEELQYELDTYRIKSIISTWRDDLAKHFIEIVENMPGNIYVRRPSDAILNEIKQQIVYSIEQISITEEPLFLYDCYMIIADNSEANVGTKYTYKSNIWLITNQSIYELYMYSQGKQCIHNDANIVQIMPSRDNTPMPYGTFYGFVKHKTIQYKSIPALQKFCASRGHIGTCTYQYSSRESDKYYMTMIKKLRDTFIELC